MFSSSTFIHTFLHLQFNSSKLGFEHLKKERQASVNTVSKVPWNFPGLLFPCLTPPAFSMPPYVKYGTETLQIKCFSGPFQGSLLISTDHKQPSHQWALVLSRPSFFLSLMLTLLSYWKVISRLTGNSFWSLSKFPSLLPICTNLFINLEKYITN